MVTRTLIYKSYISTTKELHKVVTALELDYNNSTLWEEFELIYPALNPTFILVINPNKYHSPFD